MSPLVALALPLCLLAGLALGWLVRGRLLANGAEDAAELRRALDATRDALGRSEIERSALAAERQARTEAFEAQIRQLQEAKEQLTAQFAEVGGKLLEQAQRQFLERADQRFHQAGEKSEAQLKALLNPVETTLKRYEEGLQRVEKERVDSYAGLREAVDQVRVGQGQVRDEAAKLVNALRASPKARGRWGEQSLRNVLEQSGLSPYADFATEVSVDTEDGRLRPDVVVRLPGGRKLIVDAKCSFNAYLDATEEVDEAARTTLLKAHAAALRTHASQLGQKSYWDRFGEAADYVVMYIPGEHFLSAAMEQDPELWDWAHQRRVLIATPINLVALARTIASVWRQEKMAEEARAIGRLGKEMYERLSVAVGHLRRVGGGLNSAVENYNKFVSSFEGRVLVTGRKFRDLNVETGDKEIDEIPAIETRASEPSVDLLASPEETGKVLPN
ncbi:MULTISPECIES: DNA recombination protein RmuC [unclassified Sphingomonas]|uniref:DNA recombination protein RmuC n=1 Tax=unclassified Sphingomonas TaxID=196159 RepID=UPI0006FE2B07|nr:MULTISPECIES: DNA recombination protein RmuC [unclassified Sphingomonas]KQX20097.1 recombinase RmuC [Sphingomonas sp. Root1294]KQY67348.1 recombinase RmuC [Sphingomonas sp. Root50]KRB90725.1 recombinase RmuC [Sphingomonas sp. Root720]